MIHGNYLSKRYNKSVWFCEGFSMASELQQHDSSFKWNILD